MYSSGSLQILPSPDFNKCNLISVVIPYRFAIQYLLHVVSKTFVYYADGPSFRIESIFFIFELVNKQSIIDRTLRAINQLPENKAEEISVFADFLIKRYEEQKLTEGIQKLAENSQAFNFLNEEEDIYSEDDLKEIYNAQR